MDEKAKKAEEEFALLLKKQKEVLAFEKASTKKIRDDFKAAKQRLIQQKKQVGQVIPFLKIELKPLCHLVQIEISLQWWHFVYSEDG